MEFLKQDESTSPPWTQGFRISTVGTVHWSRKIGLGNDMTEIEYLNCNVRVPDANDETPSHSPMRESMMLE